MAKIILVRGKAGVGKTLISNELSKKLNVSVLRKDDIFDTIFEYLLDNQTRNKFCYELIFKMITTNLECNVDLIIDCPFHHEDQLNALQQKITEHKGVFIPILCICSDENLWANRFNQRKNNPSPNNLITDFEEMKLHYINKGIKLEALKDELVLDTITEVKELMNQVLQYIKSR
jgi:2-phosphoglycerate kinase